MDINAAYQQYLGRGAAQPEIDHWTKQLAAGISPFAMQSNLAGSKEGIINSAYNQLLGHSTNPGALDYLVPALDEQGTQAVRQRLAGSQEYQDRMLGPPSSPWQTAARQATSNQSMMPGTFWDYTNPLFADPQAGRNLLFPSNTPGSAIMSAILDPNADWIKALLPKGDDKKKSGASGAASYPSQSHGYTLSDAQQAMLETSMLDRARAARVAEMEKRFGANG